MMIFLPLHYGAPAQAQRSGCDFERKRTLRRRGGIYVPVDFTCPDRPVLLPAVPLLRYSLLLASLCVTIP